MLPRPARLPDLSLTEHIGGIIGQQLQRHSQSALTVIVPSATGIEEHTRE